MFLTGLHESSAVALEIVNSIFQRNLPKPEPAPTESSDDAPDEDTEARAAAEKEAKELEKDTKARMQFHADTVLEDLMDEGSRAHAAYHAEA